MEEFTRSLKIYIVEDSTILRRLLTSSIESAGAELIGTSRDAQSALADLAVVQPDLILIDLMLDSGSGFDVLREMKARSLVPMAIKVVLTNHASADYERLSFQLGADRFFDKSSGTWEVLGLIHTLAAEKRHSDNPPHGANHHGLGNHSRN